MFCCTFLSFFRIDLSFFVVAVAFFVFFLLSSGRRSGGRGEEKEEATDSSIAFSGFVIIPKTTNLLRAYKANCHESIGSISHRSRGDS